MYYHYNYRLVHRPLYRGVLYSECPLSEVPLYITQWHSGVDTGVVHLKALV